MNTRRQVLFQGIKTLGVAATGVAVSSTVGAVEQTQHQSGLSIPFQRHHSVVQQAPYGNQFGVELVNYNRVSPYIATAGLLQEAGLVQAKKLGFKLILDLRGADEDGVRAESAQANALGLQWVNIPVTSKIPTDGQVEEFASWIENANNYPILVHCVSANRTGAMWALYRASRGVGLWVAVEEGVASGLASRRNAVEKALSL